MKNLLFSFLILLNFNSACSAQIIDAIIEGGTSSVARIYDVDVDQWGNRFVVGYTQLASGEPAGFIDFDPNPDNQVLIPTRHHFVAKYSPKGRLLFAKGMEDLSADGNPTYYNHNINVLSDGSFVISGVALDTDFDPGPGIAIHPSFSSSGFQSSFVAKYSSSGNLIFLHSFLPTNTPGQAVWYCRIRAQDVTSDGTIVLAGDVYGTVDFDPSPGGTASFAKRIFLLKLDANGNYIEHHVFDNDATQYTSTSATDVVALETGSIILTGRYNGTLDLDPGPGVVEIQTTSNPADCSGGQTNQSFIVKLGSNGQFENGFQFEHLDGCGFGLDGNRITAKSRDNKLYLRVANSYQMDLNPGPAVVPSELILNETGNLVILDTSLNYIESKIIPGGDGSSLVDDFCLTKTGFAVASQAGNYIDYTIGGNIDLLPFPGGSGNHFHILEYDENFNFVNGLISYQPPAGPLGGVFFDESSGQVGGYLNFEIGLPTETNIYSINGELIENGASNIQSSTLISVPNRNQIDGTVYIDDDNSGTITENDRTKQHTVVSLKDDTGDLVYYSITDEKGAFRMYADSGSFASSVNIPPPAYWNSIPITNLHGFTATNSLDTSNFLLGFDNVVTDVSISAINQDILRYNNDIDYEILITNIGTQTETVDVTFEMDPGYTFLGSDLPAVVNGSTLTWGQVEVETFETVSVTATILNGVNSGAQTTNTFNVSTNTSDANPTDNSVTLAATVTGPLDPNDKQVFPREELTSQEANDGKMLDYLIRFQNVGTDTAFNVYILDTLSNWLDKSTLQMLTSSDDYEVSFLDTNVIEFRFNNIQLPDSLVDEPNSHGFIAYRMRMKGGLSFTDTVYNNAAIYFDYEEPVITNTTKNYVQLITSTNENENYLLSVYPNPSNGKYYVNAKGNVRVFDVSGKEVYRTSSFNAPTEVDLSALPSGVYTIQLTNKGGVFTGKVVRE